MAIYADMHVGSPGEKKERKILAAIVVGNDCKIPLNIRSLLRKSSAEKREGEIE